LKSTPDTLVNKHDVFASYAWGTMDGNPRLPKMIVEHELEVFLAKDHLGKANVLEQFMVRIEDATMLIPFLKVLRSSSAAFCMKVFAISTCPIRKFAHEFNFQSQSIPLEIETDRKVSQRS